MLIKIKDHVDEFFDIDGSKSDQVWFYGMSSFMIVSIIGTLIFDFVFGY